jgi:hypothetical protein
MLPGISFFELYRGWQQLAFAKSLRFHPCLFDEPTYVTDAIVNHARNQLQDYQLHFHHPSSVKWLLPANFLVPDVKCFFL